MPNGLASRLIDRLRGLRTRRSHTNQALCDRIETADSRNVDPLTFAEVLAASSWLELGGAPLEFQLHKRFAHERAQPFDDSEN